jgi:hypothetical protein
MWEFPSEMEDRFLRH